MYYSLSSFLKSIGYPTVDDEIVIHNLQDVSPEPPYQSPIFRANYFTFVLIKTGYSKYTIEESQYEVRDGMLYFTNPGHLKSFQLLKPVDGKLISFSMNFLSEYVMKDPFSLFPYLLSETVPPLVLSDEAFAELWSLSHFLENELSGKGLERHIIAGSYFKVFLLKVNGHIRGNEKLTKEMDKDSIIVKSFKVELEEQMRALINGNSSTLMQVASFAERQFLHPAYFTTVIKNKTGRSPQTWIKNRILREAKSMLKHSDQTIKEIAYTLGFSDANYFSKYFKKNEGLTPGAYRSKTS